MAELINPYIAGAPVAETNMFFGREDVFNWIKNSLSGRYADHVLVIHGQRRVGKTSVLKQLGKRLPEKYIPVFFDLQGRTNTTLDRFLWWLARETVRVLKQERDIEVPPPNKEDFARDPDYFENTFLPSLRPVLGNHNLLFTFDEFDNLEESEVKEELARPLINYLRRLVGREDMNFIFSIGSSGRKLENMQASYTEFFKSALYKKISFLSEEQTHQLVTQPVEGILEYDSNAVKYIYTLASGQPYFTQLICHEIISHCQNTGQHRVKKSDVDALLMDVVERGTVNLKFTWDEASAMEKWSMAAIAQTSRRMKKQALSNYLRGQHLRFNETDLGYSLLHLQETDVLTKKNDFVIHLMRLWLQENRSIDQVRAEIGEDLLDSDQEQPHVPARRFNPRTGFIFLGVAAVLIVGGILGYPTLAPMLQAPTPTQTLTSAPPSTTPSPSQTPTVTATVTVTPTPTLGVGSTQVSEKDGMVMSYIPAGEFTMGSDDDIEIVHQPSHKVYLDAFWIDQTEVTNAMYALCVEAGICNEPFRTNYFSNSDYAEHPVMQVAWNDASTYCIWAVRQLPTEAQWEKAARGGLEGMNYSWGNELPVCIPGATNGAQSVDDFGACHNPIDRTIAVASFAPNGYGVYDTIGNLAEWVADLFSDTYYRETPYENPLGPVSGNTRVVRNGSYGRNISEVLIFRRYGASVSTTSNETGFRCAQSISP